MDKDFLNIVSDVIGISEDSLNENSTAETVSGWDSIAHWAVISSLEDVYDVEFSMDEAMGFENLGDMFMILKSKL